MRWMMASAISAMAVMTAACTGTAVVKPVTLDVPQTMRPLDGRYAAWVQTGGWNLDIKNRGFVCSAWSFETPIDPSWLTAAQEGLRRALATVEFVPSPLKPDALVAGGYTGQVVLQQTNASGSYGVNAGLFVGSTSADVELTVIAALADGNGAFGQETVTAKGSGHNAVAFCPGVSEAVGAAAQDAIRSLVRDIAYRVRDNFNQRASSKPASTAASVPATGM